MQEIHAIWVTIGVESMCWRRVAMRTGRFVKHFPKIGACQKSLCGNGLRHILHAVSRQMSLMAPGNGGVWVFVVWATKIGAASPRFVVLNT